MLEALWSVVFVSSLGGSGAGVVVFKTNRIFGGDSQYYYTGRYDVDNQDNITGEMEVTHYAGQPTTVFGAAKQIHLSVSGKVQEPVMDLRGHLVSDPKQTIQFLCTKRADLP